GTDRRSLSIAGAEHFHYLLHWRIRPMLVDPSRTLAMHLFSRRPWVVVALTTLVFAGSLEGRAQQRPTLQGAMPAVGRDPDKAPQLLQHPAIGATTHVSSGSRRGRRLDAGWQCRGIPITAQRCDARSAALHRRVERWVGNRDRAPDGASGIVCAGRRTHGLHAALARVSRLETV